jgi:hypothetical protein
MMTTGAWATTTMAFFLAAGLPGRCCPGPNQYLGEAE